MPVRAAVVFAHPHPQYGGTMHTKAVYQGAKALTRIGCAVLRFNFRGVGASAGSFDRARASRRIFARRSTTWPPLSRRAALGRGLFFRLVGRARGRRRRSARLASSSASRRRRDVVSGQATRSTHTLESTKPKFFVQGEADEVCPLEDMWQFYGSCTNPRSSPSSTRADHLFDGKTQEVGEALEDLLADYQP